MVEFKEVCKKYGSVTAVDNVSFTIEKGTLATLLGPSGCGKTTTLRLIAGLEMVSSGRVVIGGRDVTAAPASERDVSMVFQSYALFPHMSVLENVAYGPSVSGDRNARDKANQKLKLLGLEAFGARMPSELSGGQQQRVAVARALVLEPQVLLFDEPLSNLDAKLRRRVREDIRDLQQGLGLTVAYVTHDQQEALAVSDRIIVMSNSRIAQIGAPRELYEAPRDRFVADFIGDANLVEGEAAKLRGHGIDVKGDGPVRVAIRPEAIVLSSGKSGALEGTVRKAAYLGTHMEYTVESPLGALFVVDRNVVTPFAPGAGVGIGFAKHGIAVVPG